jgi:Ca2+-binding EF-hand superfamily protein
MSLSCLWLWLWLCGCVLGSQDAMDENPPAQNWADGQSFDREALLNQQVLVRGHGMGTITDVSVPWSYGAAEHTIQFVEGHQLKLTLLSQENQGRNDCIAFKLARADVASPRKADILSHFQPEPGQVLRVRKTAQGFGVIIGLKGAVLSVTTAHARTAGFEQGQVIAAVNGQRVASKQQILEALTWVSLNQEVIFRVVPNDVGSPRKATLGRSPGLQPSSPRGSIRASPRTPDDVLEVDLWGDAQEELQPEPELAYDLQPQPEPQEWNLARGVSVAPNGEEWGSGAKLSDEELMGRRVRVNGHGEGRITNVVVRWGARKYTVQLDRGPVHQVALRTKEGGDKGTQFEVELNAQERRQARAEQRTRVFAQQLAGEIREVLLNESTNLKTLFTQWDTDGDGVLTKAELWEGITALTGKKINRSRLKDLMSIMDADDDGEISLDEFVKIFRAQATAASVAKRVAHRLKQQLNMRGKDLNEAFAKFDTDGDKVLSRAELVSGLRSVGIKLTKKDERDLMSVLDEDGDGEINYAEFVEMATLDEEDLEQRRKAREVKRQHEQFSRKDLATLQQLCWESGMDDSGSHQQLAAQLARNHFFVGTSQWAPGESLSDDLVAEAATNLEVRVLVKGRGYGRLLSVEKGYFSSNNHTVLLDKNQEQIRLQLRTKENASGNATYFKWQRPHSGTDEAQLQNAQEMWDNGKATMELRERAGEAQRRHADAEQATIAAAQAAADSQTAISKQQEQEEEAMRQEAQAKQAQLQRRLAEKEAEEQRIREEARQRARAEGWLQRKQMLNGVAVRMGSAAKAAAGACAALVLACVLAMDSSYLYRLVHGPRTVDALTLEGVQRALIRTIVYGCILVIIADRLPAALKSTRLRSYDVGLLLLLLVLQLLQWLSCTAYLSEPRWPWLDWVRADCVQDLQGILSRPAGRVPLLAAKHTLLLRLGMRTATLPWRRLSPATLTSRRGFQMLGAAIAALIIQGAVVWLLVTSADEQALSSNLIMWLCFTLLPQWLALNAALVYGVLVVLTLELVRSQYNLQAQRVVAVVSAGESPS